jgi:hypothetical protein
MGRSDVIIRWENRCDVGSDVMWVGCDCGSKIIVVGKLDMMWVACGVDCRWVVMRLDAMWVRKEKEGAKEEGTTKGTPDGRNSGTDVG